MRNKLLCFNYLHNRVFTRLGSIPATAWVWIQSEIFTLKDPGIRPEVLPFGTGFSRTAWSSPAKSAYRKVRPSRIQCPVRPVYQALSGFCPFLLIANEIHSLASQEFRPGTVDPVWLLYAILTHLSFDKRLIQISMAARKL